ncbi:MAG: hypothetical protein QNJ46_30130 [Leptolyngbyaceae cyanobacterium MO_188.B28]|nr:hypothetical protein [Leptolyngbyaceae cyanobacterium MO_188.B28]
MNIPPDDRLIESFERLANLLTDSDWDNTMRSEAETVGLALCDYRKLFTQWELKQLPTETDDHQDL